ncbi:MAG: hypothetical protein AAGA83_17775 [Cyanobacteria bacterium P01_F01_bin.116]
MRPLSSINLRELAADIEFELGRLRQLEQSIQYVQQEIEQDPAHTELFYENLALKLHSFYTGCERIFSLIATELNGGLPSGSDWHKRLLDRMSTEREGRIAVVHPDTAKLLKEVLGFRHVVRSLYGFELDPAKIQRLIENYPIVWGKFEADMLRFVVWLRDLATKVEGPSL